MANSISEDQQGVYCHCSEFAEDNPTSTGRNGPDIVIDTNVPYSFNKHETIDIRNVDSMSSSSSLVTPFSRELV